MNEDKMSVSAPATAFLLSQPALVPVIPISMETTSEDDPSDNQHINIPSHGSISTPLEEQHVSNNRHSSPTKAKRDSILFDTSSRGTNRCNLDSVESGCSGDHSNLKSCNKTQHIPSSPATEYCDEVLTKVPEDEDQSNLTDVSDDVGGTKQCGDNISYQPVLPHDTSHFWTDDASPAKRIKTEDTEIGLETQHETGTGASENGPTKLSIPVKESDDSALEPTKIDEQNKSPDPTESPSNPTSSRSSRRTRKKPGQEVPIHKCPVCGCSIRPKELAAHLQWELDKVDRLSSRSGRKSGVKLQATGSGKVQPNRRGAASTSFSSEGTNEDDSYQDPQERYQTYKNVKEGRETRICARDERYNSRKEETTCPVCEKKVTGSPEQLAEHVESCLKKQEDEAVNIDVIGDDDEEYEEYEWAGQTRIRTSTLLPGGLAASGFQAGSKVSPEEEDDIDLDVDGCDQATFGEAQYCEKDIIAPNADNRREKKQRSALRRAYLRTEVQSVQSEPSERDRWKITAAASRPRTTSQGSDEIMTEPMASGYSKEDSDSLTAAEIIESLKVKIREQEKLIGKDIPKCLICMEPYHIPLTSIQCWHVHCEECWLRTLGAKKLCPQCNMITSASDLRKVYL